MAETQTDARAPRTIYRTDYTAPEWLIPEVALDFTLDSAQTIVKAVLKLSRNGEHDHPVRLNIDGTLPEDMRLNGQPVNGQVEGDMLVFPCTDEQAILEMTCRISPVKNTALSGLYASGGMLCTQCEAEGFRRIIPFIDRPDNLSVYTVTMRTKKSEFPILLSNGDLLDSGDWDGDMAMAHWHDPHPKPSYLFALVAGDLVAHKDSFTTMDGRHVDLAIWVREKDLPQTHFAMHALKQAMAWDEQQYGRVYDLGLFNIVAVDDFNMGAMENKGLNIFNSRYILGDKNSATDTDFDNIESVVSHEYFHNWSGNRVTCRDWFQLSLKEGFTVYRDQCFSADMAGSAVKRIEDVRNLRAVQFPEDAALAHNVRPDSYMEINNFYTATIYNKGAEVIRMMALMAGQDNFRKGCDLYFDRHDGEAVTCEDFVRAMEEGAGLDLEQFRLWYSQAGTPQLHVQMEWDALTKNVTLHVTQNIPPSAGQATKQPMAIPVKLALFDSESEEKSHEQIWHINNTDNVLTLEGFSARPILSFNRGFSAPIITEIDREVGDLEFLARHDDDGFARYEALQQYMVDLLVANISRMTDEEANIPHNQKTSSKQSAQSPEDAQKSLIALMKDILALPALDDKMRALLLTLPDEAFLGEQLLVIRPDIVHRARNSLLRVIAREMADEWRGIYDWAKAQKYSADAKGQGARAIQNLALGYLYHLDRHEVADVAWQQFNSADNMTISHGALSILACLKDEKREMALDIFYNRFPEDGLVLDKWFAIQAGSRHPQCFHHVKSLSQHKNFTLNNPNRVRALYWTFANNQMAFHHESGRGYSLLGDVILQIDRKNPQLAARFIPILGRWRRYDEERAGKMREILHHQLLSSGKLSRDSMEQAHKSLA